MDGTDQTVPSKARTEALLVERVDDETVVYDLESKQVHCLSPVAAAVFELCDGDADLHEISTQATERLSRSVTVDTVRDAVAQLEECRLLDTLETPLKIRGGHTRREAVRKVAFAGATAAFAAPLITSIVSPSAAMALSGLPEGCSCTKNKDCLSDHCCADTSGKKCNTGCCADNSGNACQCVVIGGVGQQCATIGSVDPLACGSAGVCTPSPAGFNCNA